MGQHDMYGQMVFYLEACESATMFKNLTDTSNIYAVTAANSTQPSKATYCPPYDVVNGTKMNACLGDLFSVNWMQNTEAVGTKQSLDQ